MIILIISAPESSACSARQTVRTLPGDRAPGLSRWSPNLGEQGA